jgi:geranylgeranyl reductase family protein
MAVLSSSTYATRIRTDAEVIVVGGGPAGSSTAWHLARHGVDVILLDRARFPRSKACAEYVSPEAARILDAMGALHLIDASDSTALTGMTVVTPSGAQIRGNFLSTHGFRGFRDAGIGCRREILDTVLLDQARNAGVRVLEQHKVELVLRSATGQATGVSARDSNGAVHEYRAHVVVAADGLRSTIAHRLNVAHRNAWPNRLAIMAHYTGVQHVTSHGEMHVSHDGYFGIAKVGHGDTAEGIANIALVIPAAHMSSDVTPTERLDRWIAARPELARRFRAAHRVSRVRVTGPFASRARRAWAPGALLVGDAADFFDPFTGEGIYAALRGGELALPHISDAVDAYATGRPSRATRALRGYEQSRTRAFAGKWRVEKMIGLAVSNPWLLDRAARALSGQPEVSDLLIGVTGDFVPPSKLLSPRILFRLLFPPGAPRHTAHA